MSNIEPETKPDLGHVESVALQLAGLHADYQRGTTRSQRLIAQLTAWIGTPIVLVALMLVVAAWIVVSEGLAHFGTRSWDPAPFSLLSLGASLLALFTTILILAAQRTEDELARRRAQLTLQLATQTEQMISKVIHLLEEQRRENPLLPNRRDAEAEMMAVPSDPKVVLGHMMDSRREADARVG